MAGEIAPLPRMKTVRAFALSSALLLTLSAPAATLNVEVSRNGFTGPIEIAVAPRLEGRAPEWSAMKRLASDKSAVTFPGLAAGLYIVLASGPEPLQRLSAKSNLGSAGGTIRLAIPKTETAVRVTLGGEELPRAAIALTHHELHWGMDVATDEHGRFAGPLWEPGL
ncbi:MAG: hypothetical protein QOH21_2604, partial [Acidobacteriota bacterium]|nr:hypothetical protein [Acidobacteriota bacterium]